MNRTALKNYAPIARREFIQAMTDRAAHFGMTASKVEPLMVRGDSVVIGGRQFPQAVATKRTSLEERVKRDGFGSTMESIAYTWFNRFAALRYMELHGYLEHGYRVLSHPEGKSAPEVLEHAEHLELPGLQQDAVINLKIAGDKEEDLYRLILLAQCNALHTSMPFLFEKIDDETELLLPDNLLRSDSIIRQLVESIAEEDWTEVEIIGWLYQFYISERNREVIGKVVASEDIPAATQLFTPNWIVKYLVQNTLGRQWLATYPQSTLRQQMEYYIEPAEQTPEVQEQLKAITPKDLNPEELTLLDPACGSGHILVEAYDLFKAIYQERGYQAKGIPGLILQKNLFGLEIDDRAAQLAAFALMMKARADDRRLFESDAKPNIVALQESKGLDAAAITHALNSPINKDDAPKEFLFEEIEEEEAGLFSKKVMAQKGHVSQADITALVELFEHAKTFGSLIQVPPKLAAKLPEIENRLNEVLKNGDLTHVTAQVLKPLLQQAGLLARQYDAVVANPPYLGYRNMNASLKKFGKDFFSLASTDLFSISTLRYHSLAGINGYLGIICPFVWMTISSFIDFRKWIISESTITSLIQLEYNAFEPACVPVCTFVLHSISAPEFKGTYVRLADFKGHENQAPRALEAIHDHGCRWRYITSASSFSRIPDFPIAYWVSQATSEAFQRFPLLGQKAKKGLTTSDNGRFLRLWHEVSLKNSSIDEGGKWFPTTKGGKFRKWYGNHEYFVNWEDSGIALKSFVDDQGKPRSVLRNIQYYFKSGVTWNALTISPFTARFVPEGFIPNAAGPMVYGGELLLNLCMLNSCVNRVLTSFLAPTFNYEVGIVALLPVPTTLEAFDPRIAHEIINLAKSDWDSFETSWDFKALPVLENKSSKLLASQESADAHCLTRFALMKKLEEENNRLFIEAYSLQDELSPEVPDDQITLYRPDREEDIKRLISYAIGCMMGRYSLDKPGLIYAHSGNEGFDFSHYATFPADDDGIVPILETDWGIHDDATNRFVEFIGVAWPKEHLEENLTFVAESLGGKPEESARDVIRHYLASGFFKHHLQMYKRRPIYWLFSSGKQKAFQCLVYLHRYNEGTLARMRTEYVIPLMGKVNGSIDQLEGDKIKVTSTAHRKKLQKEQDDLKKQKAELLSFDEKLKNYADQRIKIDLDDGVKVNYAKFGDILAEVRAVTGGAEE